MFFITTGPFNSSEYFGFKATIKDDSSLKDVQRWLDKKTPVIVNWFTRGAQDCTDADIAEGHYSAVAGLDDEYIYIDIKEENVEFNCGDLDNISERWKDIPGWNSFSFSGCTLSNLKRGTFNSIMREQGDYDKETWKDAWGPINEYRLKQELDKI